EMRATANVSGIGRTVVIAFPGLPASVSLVGASGTTPAGAPYINLSPAIGAGGLEKGSQSAGVQLQFTDISGLPFSLHPQILVGPGNRPPTFGAISPLSMKPGEVLDVPLSATDPDGDPETFSISASTALPNVTLTAGGHLMVQPAPGQEGTYSFQVVASDG